MISQPSPGICIPGEETERVRLERQTDTCETNTSVMIDTAVAELAVSTGSVCAEVVVGTTEVRCPCSETGGDERERHADREACGSIAEASSVETAGTEAPGHRNCERRSILAVLHEREGWSNADFIVLTFVAAIEAKAYMAIAVCITCKLLQKGEVRVQCPHTEQISVII